MMMMIFILRIPQQGLNPGRGGLHKQHYLKWQSTMPTQNLLQKKKKKKKKRRRREEDVDGKEENA